MFNNTRNRDNEPHVLRAPSNKDFGYTFDKKDRKSIFVENLVT